MKPLLTAATIALLAAAGPSLADQHKTAPATATQDSAGNFYTNTEKTDFLASKLIGARVYATTQDFDSAATMDKISTDWDDIGEINNIIIGKDNAVKAVVLGVGGFLSIGEKNVAVKMSELSFVKKSGDHPDDYFIVVKSDKETLEKAPTWKAALN